MPYFDPKDVHIYDELKDITVAAAVTKGQGVVINDVFGFYLKSVSAADIADDRDDVSFIYRMRQVDAPKRTGTGEDIQAGEKVYWYPAEGVVSANPVGTAGTDYYFCGWAKETVTASASTVLINFDGTRYDEAI